jgi:hypothetical protein
MPAFAIPAAAAAAADADADDCNDNYARSEVSAADSDTLPTEETMSELLEESRSVEAALTLEYEAQITDLELRSIVDAISHRVELDTMEAQHALELRRRDAEVDAARSLVNINAFTAQMRARQEKATAIKNLEDRACELLNVRTQLHEANTRLQGLSVGSRSLATLHKSNVMEQLAMKQGRANLAAAQSADGASNLDLSESHARRLVAHLETVLFASAKGNIERTHLLLLQLLDRPRVQHLLKTYGIRLRSD